MSKGRMNLDGYTKRDPSEPDRVISIWGGKRYGPHLWIGTDKGGPFGASMWASLSDRAALRRLARRILRDLDATKHRRPAASRSKGQGEG